MSSSSHNYRMESNTRLLAGVFAISLIICACGTGEGETELRARFDSDPTGGQLVQSMESEFTINREFTDNSGFLESSASPEDVSVTVEWVQNQAGVFDTERLTVDESQKTFRTTVSTTGPDTYFTGRFFVRLSWNDDSGRKEAESSRALCTIPESSEPADRLSEHIKKVTTSSRTN